MKYYVYCHTSPSGKKYVGWTSYLPSERWASHVRFANAGKPYALSVAIRKYGAENFKHEILEVMATEAGVQRAEQLWIKHLGTKVPAGYNMTDGGDGTSGAKWTEESKRKIRGVPKSPATIAKFKSKTIPEHIRRYGSERQVGELNARCKFSDETIEAVRRAVLCGTPKATVSREFGMSRGYINDIMAGKNRVVPTPATPPVYTKPAHTFA